MDGGAGQQGARGRGPSPERPAGTVAKTPPGLVTAAQPQMPGLSEPRADGLQGATPGRPAGRGEAGGGRVAGRPAGNAANTPRSGPSQKLHVVRNVAHDRRRNEPFRAGAKRTRCEDAGATRNGAETLAEKGRAQGEMHPPAPRPRESGSGRRCSASWLKRPQRGPFDLERTTA